MAVNPKSLLNLKPGERQPRYEEPKKQRTVSVTDVGWHQLKAIADSDLGLSVSEMMEQLGRGNYKLVKSDREG